MKVRNYSSAHDQPFAAHNSNSSPATSEIDASLYFIHVHSRTFQVILEFSLVTVILYHKYIDVCLLVYYI